MATLNGTEINLSELSKIKLSIIAPHIEAISIKKNITLRLNRTEAFILSKIHNDLEKYLLGLMLFVFELKKSEITNKFSRKRNILTIYIKNYPLPV